MRDGGRCALMRLALLAKSLCFLALLIPTTLDAAEVGQTPAAAPSPYEVVWTTPSADSHGTMPLGNGEVAVNAWIEPSGDLRFYLARTDSWDDNGRLLKIGAVRVRTGAGAAAAERTKSFRQALTVKDGTIRARYGTGEGRVDLSLWVDANRPVICVEVETARPTSATAAMELWRNAPTVLTQLQTSDIFARHMTTETVAMPDTVLAGLQDRVGWYHRNIKSVGPELCARIQGAADFPRPDPLLYRTCGALIAATRPERLDDRTLRSQSGTRHLFEIYVYTKHPATAEAWLADAQRGLDAARAIPLAERRAAHEAWWAAFWNRSWIEIRSNALALPGVPARTAGNAAAPAIPGNRHPLRIGLAQNDSSRFSGAFGRVGIYGAALTDEAVRQLAATQPQASAPASADIKAKPLYSAIPEGPKALPELARQGFGSGLTVEAWIKPEPARGRRQEMRIIDKIKPGGADGFLLDIQPGLSLRLIAGTGKISKNNVLIPGQWQHVAATVTPAGEMKIFLNGKTVTPAAASLKATAVGEVTDGDDPTIVSRAYALQRFINACAGRGNYPIKYNGSLFTVPSEGGEGDADYRRWGPGYWWQNTRLPYYSMCASGDFDLLEPLFKMYGRDLMPLFKFRTQRQLGHAGAFITECIYFWGDIFPETYGWQPFEERTDKLQSSGYHKWEWVSGLELTGLMLDRYEHTGDVKFLRETALPTAREILTFFAEQYKDGPDGKMVMHPAQALETWWDCTNPMPELSGLHAITERLMALPETVTRAEDRAFWTRLRARLPDLPTTTTADGKVMLAPAQIYKGKRNVENPELYAVFPFRQIALGRPHQEWGVEALNRRLHSGALGWRQDDLFMAWLGQTEQARDYVVKRARTKNAASRFPAFWGPNYDWLPDQCHGGVLLRGVQSLLMQTDGRKIYLLPAWPRDWDADFKLHAPLQTTVEGKVRAGEVIDLKVEPAERGRDVILCGSQTQP